MGIDVPNIVQNEMRNKKTTQQLWFSLLSVVERTNGRKEGSRDGDRPSIGHTTKACVDVTGAARRQVGTFTTCSQHCQPVIGSINTVVRMSIWEECSANSLYNCSTPWIGSSSAKENV